MSTRVATRVKALSPSALIGLLTAGVVAATATLFLTFLRDEPAAHPAFHLAWWILAPLVYLSEITLVHLHFRRDNHSFSLNEVAIVLALMFSPSWEILAGQVIGAVLAFGVHRRLSPLKLTFNVAVDALVAVICMLVFRGLVPHFDTVGPSVWVAAFAASITAGMVSGTTVVAAISLSEGRLQVDRLRTVLTMATVASVTNTSLALIAGTLLLRSPETTILLGIPIGTVFLSYGAYLREREKHESLEFLYASTRILSETPELEHAVVSLVGRAREMFRAETAQMLFVIGDNSEMLRTRVSDDSVEVMTAVDEEAISALWNRVSSSTQPLLLQHPTGDPDFDNFMMAEGMKDAMITALRGEDRAFGMAVVGNRVGGVTFDAEDARLFETLASHTSVALENGRLEQSLTQLRELEQRLKHLAFHDPLTGLANRTLFAQRVDNALSHHDCRSAVLFIDLDDFKTVNDTLGHAAGDQLLVAVGGRITACLRPEDHAARLGGDEFAVLLDEIVDVEDAQMVSSRINEALRLPFTISGQEVRVGASIGIAPAAGVATADELLRNADLAMYMAKADGKGSF